MLTTYLGTPRIARLRTAVSSSSAGIDGSRQLSENELAITRRARSGQACRADRERTRPAVKQWARSALIRALAVRLVLAHPLAGKTESGAKNRAFAGSKSASALRSAFAALRSAVSNPSVNRS